MAEDKFVGTRLEGRYEILELVGEGGMANVYKANDRKENRVVAVKILKDEFLDNEELVRRFKNESRAISVLNHPNIVKVYDISVSSKLQYIVMEYIDGITLKEYIEQRGEPLTYKESIHFVSQVLKALQHAHDKGIVHRDIKPQNIMLLEDGSVKVMDFGIARLSRSESHTVEDQAIGSVHYISPEQAKGDLTDPRADIYSTGIMLYEMLSGCLPFESDNAVSIAIKQISDEAKPLREVNPSVPAGLAEITAKAMAKDPKRRYQSALDMLRDIEEFKKNPSIKFEYEYLAGPEPRRYMERMATNAKRGPSKSGAKKRKKKHSILVPVVGGITLAVVITCFVMVLNIFASSGNPLFSDVPIVDVPEFVGMTEEEAKALQAQNPEYKNLKLEFQSTNNPNKGDGEIVSQNPSYPKQIKATQRIILKVNTGSRTVAVPDVAGKSRADAAAEISALGLRPYVKPYVDETGTVPIDNVVETDPKAGVEVQANSGAIVTIYVSSRAVDNERTVPDLIDVTSEADARKLVEAEQLELVSVKKEHSDKPVGQVIAQSPAAHTKVYAYTSVSITISDGPAPPPPPESVPPESSSSTGIPITPPFSSSSSPSPTTSSETTPPVLGGAILPPHWMDRRYR